MNEDFNPDWVSHPGETIMDLLDEQGLDADDFVTMMEMNAQDVNDLLDGKMKITHDIAAQLEKILGGPPGFWMELDLQYRAHIS